MFRKRHHGFLSRFVLATCPALFWTALGLAGSGSAQAGPWAQDTGAWIVVIDSTRELSGPEYDRVSWRPGQYLEYGMTKGWTLVLKNQTLLTDDGVPPRQTSEITIRSELWRGRNAAFGVAFETLLGNSLLGPACGQGVGFNMAAGTGFDFAGRHGYAAVDATAQYRGGSCLRQKLASAVGLDITPKWQITWKNYHERGEDILSTKIELAISRSLSRRFTLGVGYRAEIGGAFNEQALLVSLQSRGKITGNPPPRRESRAFRRDWPG